MCGISGVVGPEAGDLDAVVDAQIATLEHRGPDAHGSFAGSEATIAQNRLAIIDLVTGDPPITNEDRTVAVVLNGEIYNFRELREELIGRGHELRSRGDTEVIAHLAEELSPVELARRLDGMFAFAVWDERRGRLVLGRDRVGKKPLYYWSAGGRLVFGSELKALFADPAVPRRLDPGAIPAYLTFGYVPTPRTFFDGVRSLPPGHVLTFEPGGEPLIERYWQPPVAGVDGASHLDLSLDEAAAEARSRLEDAVRRRLISDVPLGAFLSGGIDSSAVVGIMASQLDRPVQTFTIGFDDREGFDERPYAQIGGAAARHRPPRVRRPPGRRRSGRAARLAPRPAVRRLERGADLPAQRADPRARHRGALGRRRRRGVRRLRALRRRARGAPVRGPAGAASGGGPRDGRPASTAGAARARGQPAAVRRRGAARTSRRLPGVDQLRAGSGARSAARRSPRRLGSRGLPRDLGLLRRRSPARPPAGSQPAHLPARRPAGEDRPDEHGPRTRGPLPVPRHRAAVVRDPPAAGVQGPRR